MKPTQEDFVKNHLKEHGKVSRNFLLSNFISRASAIIFNLKAEGWDIEGEWVKTERGRDFVYVLKGRPTRKKSVINIIGGRAVETFIEVLV